MRNRRNHLLIVLASIAALGTSGCGGSGGGNSTVPTASAEGMYQSTTDSSIVFVLDNGTVYYASPGAAEIMRGTVSASNAALSGSGTYFTRGPEIFPTGVDLSGSYAYRSSLNLQMSRPGFTFAPFSGTFVPGSVTPAKLADAAGSYVNGFNASAGTYATIDASGNINFASGVPCNVTTTIHPHAGDNAYDAVQNIAASSVCSASSVTGLAIPDGTSLFILYDNGTFSWLQKAS